ncbi:MAG: polyprenyl diphosphate synthase [Pirellulaceae bacterium]
MSDEISSYVASVFPGLDADKLPSHIAFIMDGNGRWATRQGLPRIEGHRRGVGVVRKLVEEAAALGLAQITLYCLSSENWKRPQPELDFLMALLEQYVIEERSTLLANRVALKVIGRRDGIPAEVQAQIDLTEEMTAPGARTVLCLAVNYGARGEIVDAVKEIARRVRLGELDVASLDETTLDQHLYTAGMPDPDLLVRTAGEMRVSNFLLWQISYAELWVTEDCWPDFSIRHLHQAMADFAGRERRYGGLPSVPVESSEMS